MHPEAFSWVVEQVEKWGPFYRGFIHYEVNSTGQDVRCWAVR